MEFAHTQFDTMSILLVSLLQGEHGIHQFVLKKWPCPASGMLRGGPPFGPYGQVA